MVKRSEEEEENRYNETHLWKYCVGWSQEEKKVDLKLRILMCFLVLIPQLQREAILRHGALCCCPGQRKQMLLENYFLVDQEMSGSMQTAIFFSADHSFKGNCSYLESLR